MKKALIAMSGGVDSSIAAYLTQQEGYACIGCTMKLYENADADIPAENTCCSLDDIEDARSVAFRLDMPYYVFQMTDLFREKVIRKFCESYCAGRTPNPCIDCNRFLKFEALLARADALGCEKIVTGHYARIEETAEGYLLKKAADPAKDQSYVLYMLTQAQLARILFPLGTLKKQEVRELAEQQGFVNAHKHDSQDICFVPDGDYARFIEAYTGQTFPQGDFIDQDGHPLGRHNGIIRYTIGQRKGLGLSFGTPMYVIAKDAAANTVTLGPNEALFRDTVIAHEVNWLSIACPDAPIRVEAKVRYNQQAQPATLYPLSDDRVQVVFDAPQRAITPGQALVCYRDDLLLCGGVLAGASIPPDGAEPSDGYHP